MKTLLLSLAIIAAIGCSNPSNIAETCDVTISGNFVSYNDDGTLADRNISDCIVIVDGKIMFDNAQTESMLLGRGDNQIMFSVPYGSEIEIDCESRTITATVVSDTTISTK